MISIFVQLVWVISDQRLDLLSKYANSSKHSYLNIGPPHLSGATETASSAYITQPITYCSLARVCRTRRQNWRHNWTCRCCPNIDRLSHRQRPSNLDGKSFKRVLQGKRNTHKKYAFGIQTSLNIHYGTPYPIRSIRIDNYQLIHNLMPITKLPILLPAAIGSSQNLRPEAIMPVISNVPNMNSTTSRMILSNKSILLISLNLSRIFPHWKKNYQHGCASKVIWV